MKARQLSVVTALPLLALVLFACDDDATGIDEDLVGSYQATTFTVTTDDGTTDVLAEGGSLDITLAADGTTSGTLIIPATQSESGEEEQASMSGTWSIESGTVTFEQDADTFVRDMGFQASEGRLEGEETFGEETVHVILESS